MQIKTGGHYYLLSKMAWIQKMATPNVGRNGDQLKFFLIVSGNVKTLWGKFWHVFNKVKTTPVHQPNNLLYPGEVRMFKKKSCKNNKVHEFY